MKKSIQDLKYRQSIVKYANRFGVTKASYRYKVSRTFVYRWKNRYDGTLKSLEYKSRRPHTCPNESSQEEYDLIINYARRNPKVGLTTLWIKLRKVGYERNITTLYRSLIRLGIRISPPKSQSVKRRPYDGGSYPGERVQIDVKQVPSYCLVGDLKGKKLYQYTCIDEYSRYRHLEIYEEKSTYSSQQFILRCVKRLPFTIKNVQTDNGTEFTNRLISENPADTLFESTLKTLEIGHRCIKPYTPRHNGRVERSHGKDSRYFYNSTFYSMDDIKKKLRRYLINYNNFPMKPLKYLSPKEYLVQYTNSD